MSKTRAFERFGTLLTQAIIKVRMDICCIAPTTEKPHCAQRKRLGSGRSRSPKHGSRSTRKAANAKALLDAVPGDLHNDPALSVRQGAICCAAQDKFVEAAQRMQAAPRDPARLVNADEWWIERRLLARKLLDTNEPRTAYAVARDASLPARDIYKTESEFTAGWIALRFLNDPSTALPAFRAHRRRQRQPHRSRARWLLARPCC